MFSKPSGPKTSSLSSVILNGLSVSNASSGANPTADQKTQGGRKDSFGGSLTAILNSLSSLSEQEARDLEAMAATEARIRVTRNSARDDPNVFLPMLLKDHITGEAVSQGECHIRWQNHITDNLLAVLAGPREHGKTEQMIGRVVWELGKNQNLRGTILSAVDNEAHNRGDAIKQHIEKSSAVHEVFPNLKPDMTMWGRSQFRVHRTGGMISKDPSFICSGIFSTGTGGRTDLLWADDIADYRNSVQMPTLRPQVFEVLMKVWMQRLTDGGRFVLTSNIWHRADVTSILSSMSSWRGRVLIDRIGHDMESIWPEKWPKNRLIQKRKDVGERAFALGFFLTPMADEELLFPSSIIGESMDQPGKIRDYRLSVQEVLAMRLPMFPIFMASDLAISKSDAADFTVHFLGAYDAPHNITYAPIEVVRGKFDPTETGRTGLTLYGKFKPHLWVVETNAYQGALLSIIKLLPKAPQNIPVRAFTTGSNKTSLDVGLSAMSTRMSTGGWVVPMKGHGPDDFDHDESTCPTCIWLAEMGEQTLSGHIGTHDDLLMASWLLNEAIRLGGGASVAASRPRASEQSRADRMAPDYMAKQLDRLASYRGRE